MCLYVDFLTAHQRIFNSHDVEKFGEKNNNNNQGQREELTENEVVNNDKS